MAGRQACHSSCRNFHLLNKDEFAKSTLIEGSGIPIQTKIISYAFTSTFASTSKPILVVGFVFNNELFK